MNIVTSIHMALPDSADNTPPEWIHLTPAGTFGGKDGRGPFTLKDPADVITRSMDMARGKIVVDINHSTHVAAARGERSDAVGWVTELNARKDGIWGRVEWNGTGRQLMADHAYRGISPAIGSRPDGTVEWIEAVSLTNRPNLGVADLHSQNQETRMDLAQLRRTLGLSETATEDDINAAIARGKAAVTLHATVAKAVGLDANADDAAVLAAVEARGAVVSTHAQTEIASLQGQLTAQKKAFDTLQAQLAKTSAESWVKDLKRRKVVSDKAEARLVTLHMQDAASAEDLADSLQDVPDDSLARLSLHSQGAGRSGDKPDKLVSAMESALIPADKAGG
ncbi:phage protease [Acetobacter sp. P1H12_c]|uniref:phage protease n=1 Tax=Acetobacter sp. P1H12_c TaxID=2762621 RepID=UPI001C0572E0|nr:phage protease [Acetobacter sp. P1H12_c]